MKENYFSDFRSYLKELEARGKLFRWNRPVNKDTELMPLMRLQYRGLANEKRKAFLFENVFDSRGEKASHQSRYRNVRFVAGDRFLRSRL